MRQAGWFGPCRRRVALRREMATPCAHPRNKEHRAVQRAVGWLLPSWAGRVVPVPSEPSRRSVKRKPRFDAAVRDIRTFHGKNETNQPSTRSWTRPPTRHSRHEPRSGQTLRPDFGFHPGPVFSWAERKRIPGVLPLYAAGYHCRIQHLRKLLDDSRPIKLRSQLHRSQFVFPAHVRVAQEHENGARELGSLGG